MSRNNSIKFDLFSGTCKDIIIVIMTYSFTVLQLHFGYITTHNLTIFYFIDLLYCFTAYIDTYKYIVYNCP